MKKILLSLGVVLTSISLNAQTISNGGFETWANGQTPNQVPTGWNWFSNLDPNIVTNPVFQGTVTAGGVNAVPVVKGTTGAPEGTSYVKLTTVTRAGSVNPQNGQPYPQLDGVYGGTIIQTFATTGKPLAFSFKYKYDGKNGDSAIVFVEATKWNGTSADVVGQGFKSISTNTSTWTTVTDQTIQWAAGTADTLRIFISSSCGDILSGVIAPKDNSVFEVDEVAFTGGYLGVEENVANNLKAFPNPASDVLNISNDGTIETVSIIGMDGKVVSSTLVNNTSTSVNVADLKAGVYFYEVKTANGATVRNTFVKQ